MQIIPVASGKGGVGKSSLSANLAIALGKAGKKVVLVDLDLGASNLHLVIGQPAPKAGIGTLLTDKSSFEDVILPTDYENVSFIAGDAEIPGLSSIKNTQKNMLIRNFRKLNCDYLILDLGAGTHLTILDFFLMSPQGIIVTAPTVTATLNGYLFLKNAVFRMMDTCYPRGTPGFKYINSIKSDSNNMQRLYIPKLVHALEKVDPEHTELFRKRMKQFHPRLVMNMIDDPKDADKAQKIRRSCQQYLDLDIEHLGVMYRDSVQDRALSSKLPAIVYKPNAIFSQAIFRIAEKILSSETLEFDDDYKEDSALFYDDGSDSFAIAEEEAQDDFSQKMAYVEELTGTGALSLGDLAEIIKTQQYELSQVRKENLLLKSKLVAAAKQGFKV